MHELTLALQGLFLKTQLRLTVFCCIKGRMMRYRWCITSVINVSCVSCAGGSLVPLAAVRRQNAVCSSCQQEQDHIRISQGKESESDSPARNLSTKKTRLNL